MAIDIPYWTHYYWENGVGHFVNDEVNPPLVHTVNQPVKAGSLDSYFHDLKQHLKKERERQ